MADITPTPVPPTQVARPSRTTFRTAFQVFVGLCALVPVVVAEADLPPEWLGYLAIPLGVAAAVTRVMANPKVEAFLRRFLPLLAADPNADPDDYTPKHAA